MPPIDNPEHLLFAGLVILGCVIWGAVIAIGSAYRNGVVDGAYNKFLPRVQKILEEEGYDG